MLLSLALLLALVLYDLMHQILPPPLLYTFVGLSALMGFLTASSLTEYYWTLLIAFFIALSLAAIHFFSRGRAMGLADAPLAFGLAVLSGPVAISGFIFSFWIGAVVGIALLAQRRVGSRMGVEVPFAPFLSAGFLLAYFTQWNLFTFIAAFH
jgi:prepilin signal peptidase PulO-like enzyme (type II secretory pathway)